MKHPQNPRLDSAWCCPACRQPLVRGSEPDWLVCGYEPCTDNEVWAQCAECLRLEYGDVRNVVPRRIRDGLHYCAGEYECDEHRARRLDPRGCNLEDRGYEV